MLLVEKLNGFYGPTQILWDISLKVGDGQVVAILGGNGSGKTTILRALSGLVKATSKRIELYGKRINGLAPDQIVRNGLVHIPQERELFSEMRVIENLELGAILRKDKQSIRQDLKKIYGYFPILQERVHQRSGTLSAGEQQMLAIARALMSKPKMIMMDEPSAGLSPGVVNVLVDVLKRLKQQGIAILLVEQNVDLAFQLSSYIYVCKNGSILSEGIPEQFEKDDLFRIYYH
jgi:branched-chain amino acid transport system ATP-binding protein